MGFSYMKQKTYAQLTARSDTITIILLLRITTIARYVSQAATNAMEKDFKIARFVKMLLKEPQLLCIISIMLINGALRLVIMVTMEKF